MKQFDFGDTNYIVEFVNPLYHRELKHGNATIKRVCGKVVNFTPNNGVVLWDDENKTIAVISLDWICAMYPW